MAGVNVSIGGGLIMARSHLPDPVPPTSSRLTLDPMRGQHVEQLATDGGAGECRECRAYRSGLVWSDLVGWLGVVCVCVECHKIRGRRSGNCVCIIWGWQIVTLRE